MVLYPAMLVRDEYDETCAPSFLRETSETHDMVAFLAYVGIIPAVLYHPMYPLVNYHDS